MNILFQGIDTIKYDLVETLLIRCKAVVVVFHRTPPKKYPAQKMSAVTSSVFQIKDDAFIKLNKENQWVKLAKMIPWGKLEEKYAEQFSEKTGNPACSFRMALGSLIIKEKYQFSDEATVEHITMNPYLQYFMFFNFKQNEITLSYNEVGFTPFNVFAITGIAEAAKNVSSSKSEIGEKGIGFKSVFGVASKVLIRSGWFSFELFKENFTIPIAAYPSEEYCSGTQMTLYVSGNTQKIYDEIRNQYCQKDALFSSNPLLFLNKLTSLRMYSDSHSYMEFTVSRSMHSDQSQILIERDVEISVNLHDSDPGREVKKEKIKCSRYSYPVVFSRAACQSRYGEGTQVGNPTGKQMLLQALLPNPEYVSAVGKGALYSFLPTKMKLSVPVVVHVPFKLDASREFVDSQQDNTWFDEASRYLSELIDYVYLDWRHIVKEDIVLYIPGNKDNLFAPNNGNELCLSHKSCFSGKYYLAMPLFLTTDGSFHSADDIFCFNQKEKITKPEHVYQLMGFQKYLFLPRISVEKFQFSTESDINDRLFIRALSFPSLTEQILNYLDQIEYIYLQRKIPDLNPLVLTIEQVLTIFTQHHSLAVLLQTMSCSSIQKSLLPAFALRDPPIQKLSEIIYDDFEINEAPEKIIKYLNLCRENCICLDIRENDFFPCQNAIILSNKNTLASFAAFCYTIDHRDTFTIRINLRDASKRLDQLLINENVSASAFLRELRNVRSAIKSFLGNNGYNNYINLLLQSGSTKGRFIQELLQNADDCDYPVGVIPSFELSQNGCTVITKYNEVGFTRANVRSITSIGESTKNKILRGQISEIGEKGVGFKTVFGIADSVEIHSNGFDFSLKKKTPTIPDFCQHIEISGTQMIFNLSDNFDISEDIITDKIFPLCICLRKLRHIRISDKTVIDIEDNEKYRIITVNGKKYSFCRYVYEFQMYDAYALNERSATGINISKNQRILLYIPMTQKNEIHEPFVYNGLPTNIKANVPLVIDAPFELTTSREMILENRWNQIIRNKVFEAIISLITNLKESGLGVLRFLGIKKENDSIQLKTFSYDYLNNWKWHECLSYIEFLPVLGKNRWISASSGEALIVPGFMAEYIVKFKAEVAFSGTIIDTINSHQYIPILKMIGCRMVQKKDLIDFLKFHIRIIITDNGLRNGLYAYLAQRQGYDIFEHIGESAINLPIFPVKNKDSTIYIPFSEEIYFSKNNQQLSADDYFILDQNIMPIELFEKIISISKNYVIFRMRELTQDVFDTKYRNWLLQLIRNQKNNPAALVRTLKKEFENNRIPFNKCKNELKGQLEELPLLMANGQYRINPKFCCSTKTRFLGTFLPSIVVSSEYQELAVFLHVPDIQSLYFDHIRKMTPPPRPLSDADIEDILELDHMEEILTGFYKRKLITEGQIQKYDLDFITINSVDDEDEDFPTRRVLNIISLQNHIKLLWQNPNEYQLHMYPRWEPTTPFIGNYANSMYLSANGKYVFCQICGKKFDKRYIENNDIDVEPKYAWEQTRLSLCLQCSKDFIYYRNNQEMRSRFISSIMQTNIGKSEVCPIPIGKLQIMFTATHLAEIQEIYHLQGWGKNAPKRSDKQEPKTLPCSPESKAEAVMPIQSVSQNNKTNATSEENKPLAYKEHGFIKIQIEGAYRGIYTLMPYNSKQAANSIKYLKEMQLVQLRARLKKWLPVYTDMHQHILYLSLNNLQVIETGLSNTTRFELK